MHCFYIKDIESGLSTQQIKQIIKVLRIKNNEKIILFDKTKNYLVEWKKATNNYAIIEENSNLKNTSNIDFYIPLLKNNNTKLVIQKLTEIGVNNIFPFTSNRTIIKEKNEKIERYQKIIIEAAEQSRNFDFPQIHLVENLNNINFTQYNKILLAYENQKDIGLTKILQVINKNDKIACIVGPEGGFDQTEIDFLSENKNVQIISLGSNILRAETAVIYLAAVVKNYLEEKND